MGGGERTARGARSAQRLRGRIEDQALHATASIGVSVIVDPAQDLAKLITLADQALSILCLSHFRTENRFPLFLKMLRLAKARGRNRVEVAPLEVSLGGELPQHPSMIHAPEQSGRSHTG